MSTVEQIAAAIRALPAQERDRLAKDLPKLFPELDGEAAWERILQDHRPRPALSRMLDEVDAIVAEDQQHYPETTATNSSAGCDFARHGTLLDSLHRTAVPDQSRRPQGLRSLSLKPIPSLAPHGTTPQ